MIGYPFTSIFGMLAVIAIIATTWWIEGMRAAILSGLPWLGILTIVYFVVKHTRRQTQ
jgi:L-asparagine transporter-like permease